MNTLDVEQAARDAFVAQYLQKNVATGAEPTYAQIDAAHDFAAVELALTMARQVADQAGFSMARERGEDGSERVVFTPASPTP